MRILEIGNQKDLKKIFLDLGVDPYGVRIMLPKASNYAVKINAISCVAANILKQEMLSLGGEVALPRLAITGKQKKIDCVLIGSLAHINSLNKKLKVQSFGLNRLAENLKVLLNNHRQESFNLSLGKFHLSLNSRPYIMGIVNLTPDSFSQDGLYSLSNTGFDFAKILDFASKMVDQGADIIDLGGESSRPGAREVSAKEETARVMPAVKILAKRLKVPISVDTYKPEVACQALDNGAVIINDITALRNPKMRKVISRYKAGVVLMHMKGRPRTMQNNPEYGSLIDDIIKSLDTSILRALDSGIARDKIIIDPGIGFGKTLAHNLDILKRLREFKSLGRPILVGPSRKSFLGKILNVPPQERIFGTIAACVMAIKNGANIVRVHDVDEVCAAIKVASAIIKL